MIRFDGKCANHMKKNGEQTTWKESEQPKKEVQNTIPDAERKKAFSENSFLPHSLEQDS